MLHTRFYLTRSRLNSQFSLPTIHDPNPTCAVSSLSPAVLASRVRIVLSVNVTSQLALCTMPLLYLRGTDDRLVGNGSVDAIVSAASGPVSVARIAGPHLLLQIAPEAAWQAIGETLLQ